jgi:hypothetical protein
MKETKLLEHIHAKLEIYARRLLKEAGYVILPDLPDKPGVRRCEDLPGERGLTVLMNVVGYTRRYDGWEYELTDEDWETILSIQWDKDELELFDFMRKNGNENMLLTKLKEAGVAPGLSWGSSFHAGTSINKEFMRNRLPYHFGFTHVQPSRKNGYPSMIRMFKRPVPIDGVKAVVNEEE